MCLRRKQDWKQSQVTNDKLKINYLTGLMSNYLDLWEGYSLPVPINTNNHGDRSSLLKILQLLQEDWTAQKRI